MKTTAALASRLASPSSTPDTTSSQRPMAAAQRQLGRPAPGRSAASTLLQVAEDLYSLEPDWVVFFSEMLGVDGHIRRTFPDAESLAAFECSPQYARIRELLDELRSKQDEPTKREPRRVVTVRMPRSLHESLKAEARQLHVSINQLCISKLIRMLDEHDLDAAGLEATELENLETLDNDDRGGADL